MSSVVQLYFDLLSPYSYFAFTLLRRLRPQWQFTLVLHPISLPTIMRESGNTPPGAVPNRLKFLLQDVVRTAALHSIPFAAVHDAPLTRTRHAMLFLTAVKMQHEAVLEQLVAAMWQELFERGNRSAFATEDAVRAWLEAGKHAAWIEMGDDTSSALQQASVHAVELGAFGAPTMLVTKGDGETEFFFGSDRFDHIAAFLGQPHAAIPVGNQAAPAK